jgi:hypothetical protein
MLRDRARNTLRGASNLKALGTTPTQRQDSISAADLDDMYRLKIGDRSSFNATLSRIKPGAKVEIELFQLKRSKNKVLKAIGAIDFSKLSRLDIRKNLSRVGRTQRGGDRNKTLSLTLDSGEYYLRIHRRQGETNYQLSLSATSIVPSPIEQPPTQQPPTQQPPTEQPPNGGGIPTPTQPKFTQNWLQQFGDSQNDYTYSTTTDTDGNVYVAGVLTASDSTSRGFVRKYSSSGQRIWDRPLSAGVPGNSVVFDIAVDNSGNYYVAGAADVTQTGSDGFVAKYSSNGVLLWSDLIQTTVDTIIEKESAVDAASGLVLDKEGNVFVSGFLRALPIFSSGNAFVAKYDGSTGDRINGFGISGIAEFGEAQADAAASVAIDSNNHVYLTGITNASLTTNLDNPYSGGDAFIAKFNGVNGNRLWSQVLASDSGQDYARGIAIDSSDNIYITGQTAGTLPAGSLSANANAGEVDGFLARYSSSDGALQWVRQFGTANLDESQAIATDSTGNIYLTGETTGSLFGNSSNGGSDAWIAKYGNNGTLISSVQVGTSGDDETYGIAIGTANTVHITGQTRNAFPGFTNAGNYDAWLAQYKQD